MGLWILYLTVACPVEVLRIDLPDPRQLAVAQANLVRMSTAAIEDYFKYQSQMLEAQVGGVGTQTRMFA